MNSKTFFTGKTKFYKSNFVAINILIIVLLLLPTFQITPAMAQDETEPPNEVIGEISTPTQSPDTSLQTDELFSETSEPQPEETPDPSSQPSQTTVEQPADETATSTETPIEATVEPVIENGLEISDDTIPAGISWSMKYTFPFTQEEIDEMGGLDSARQKIKNEVQTKLSDHEVVYRVEIQGGDENAKEIVLWLEGNGGTEQFRQTVYIDLYDIIRFPLNSTKLNISAESQPQELFHLFIEGNISTGSSWDYFNIDSQEVVLASKVKFASTSFNDGSPTVYDIPLRTVSSGELNFYMSYRRPWEPIDPSPKVEVTIHANSLPEIIDLSNPNNPDIDNIEPPDSLPAEEGIDALALASDIQLPSSFDWRDYGKVTPPKNQDDPNGCGSCWAHSAVGVFESALYTNSENSIFGPGSELNLSEQYLINCNNEKVGKKKDGEGNVIPEHFMNCDGGRTYDAHKYHISKYLTPQTSAGGVLETELNYTASNGQCTQTYSHPYKLYDWHFVSGLNTIKPSITQLKKAIYTYGPVTTSICAGDYFIWEFFDIVYDIDESDVCTSGKTNHAMIIIGWDDNQEAWIVKNSWGPDWNDNGYVLVSYNVPTIGYYATYVRMNEDPTTPELSSPTSGSSVPNYLPKLSWKPSKNEPLQYEIQIARDSKFTQLAQTAAVSADPQPSYIPYENLAPDTTYYWRVRSYKLPNRWTKWSSYRSIKTLPLPVIYMVEPVEGQWVNSLRPTFDWEAIPGALGYQFQISRNDMFTKIISSKTVTQDFANLTSDLPRSSLLYWRVRTKGKNGYSTWSNTEAFNTLNPPSVPSLLSPRNGANLNTRLPFFDWKDSSNSPVSYQIQVCLDPYFDENIIINTEPEVSNYSLWETLNPGKYYWRVRSKSADWSYSNWSSGRWFRTASIVNGYVTDINGSPISGAIVRISGTPLQTITDDNGYYNLDPVQGGTRTFVITAWNYLNKSTKVTVLAGGETNKNFALSWDFNKPSTPSLQSPASSANLTTYQPSFDWNDSSHNPDGYQLQIATSSKFISGIVYDNGTLSSSYLNSAGTLSMGVYYWRVRAYNDYGTSSWSSVRSFKTPGRVYGYIYDNITKAIIPGMTVSVNGASLSDITDSNGYFSIDGIQGGKRTFTISGEGYKTTSKTITVIAGKSNSLNVFLTPSSETINIVLTWGSVPNDLDAHLWLPSSNQYHVYYSNRGSSLSFPYADLDRDDTSAYGPETVTITRNNSGKYVFAVYHFTSSGTVWSQSNAVVKVYVGGKLTKTYSVPKNNNGRWWYVFDWDNTTGVFTTKNYITSVSPAPYQCLKHMKRIIVFQ